ncbi:MAG: ABC transporter ATP-binding protein/permease [candidate division KSB1 bacterium]|nr:ABC transporter ATP-binding protein/permease [candidate division KSB1 bacterium]MDZ7334608.1 ABC transporter ATP-binding protein/permease [candidate division KSB1 bacterium]MDZ7356584.1 ABC transporter ATP-binding protein/permease [candidate division KSB1 bacterium]MDZ7399901.1 ABC transporter ATP-binding protein/permease [candidate division KSB1 bacterium]
MKYESGIYFHKLPQEVAAELPRLGIQRSNVKVAIRSDLDLNGAFRPSWLIITDESVLGITPGAYDPDHTVGPYPIHSLQKARIFKGVGSGFLQVRVQNFFINVIRFSNARREEFNRARIYLEDLIEKRNAPLDIFKKRNPWFCEKCGLALPSQQAECLRCASQGGLLKRTLRMMRPYRLFVVLLLVMMLSGVALDLVPPYLTRILVDDVLTTKQHTNWLPWLVLALAGAALFRALLNILIGRTSTTVGTRITYELRRQLQQKLIQLSVDFYDRTPVGTLITRLLHDVDYFHGFVQQVASGFLVNLFLIIGIGFMLFNLNVKLALFVLIPVPFVIAGTWFFWHTIYPRYYRYWDSQSKLASLVNGVLSGIRTVKAFAQEKREHQRFDGVAGYLRDSRRAVDRGSTTFFPIFGYAFGLGGLIIWYAGGKNVLAGQITLGTLMAFLGYLGMFYGPISALTMFSNWLTGFLTAGQRIFEILDTDVALKQPEKPVVIKTMRGRIEFRNVTFGYDPYDPVLTDISFIIDPGQLVGIVGKSGSGKTTLVNLLCRFYDPQQGQILIDGVDVREMSNQELRKHVGLVLQEPFLFRATIAENIAYGAPNATPKDIIDAAKAANAHKFILKQPSGYDTRLGERGAGLSGGERQRVSIARALLCNPTILILDEATSSVDTESEQQIQEALAVLTKGRTTIAIAHRLSTLRGADIIYVLDEGKIVEFGNHEELMAKQGIYYKLVMIQTRLTKLDQ